MKKWFLLFGLFWGFGAQLCAQPVSINYLQNKHDPEVKAVMKLWENYVRSRPDSLYDNPYWNNAEKKFHKDFDFLAKEFQPSLYMGFPSRILSIKSDKGVYAIKIMFSACQPDGAPQVLAIANYIAKKEQGVYKLYNVLPFNRKQWQHSKVGYVDYYYPSYHSFDSLKARQMNAFVEEVSRNFEVKPRAFEYYLANDFTEIQQLKGFDYWLGMGGEVILTGKASDDKLYCGGLGEYYAHEVFHLLTGIQYPNAHLWAAEGMATFLGGSRGKPLRWHLKRTHAHVSKHPEIDLTDLLQLNTLDVYTSYRYVLGGLICQLIYQKGGYKQLRAFMNAGKTDEEYYAALKKFLHIDRKGLNEYLRKQLALYST